jgi:hypothetical protein
MALHPFQPGAVTDRELLQTAGQPTAQHVTGQVQENQVGQQQVDGNLCNWLPVASSWVQAIRF